MRSSVLITAWRKPRECLRPAMASSRAASSPRTLTYTRALRRSGVVSTPVTVTKPMRGSFRPAASCAERTSLTASFTLRILALAILDHPSSGIAHDLTHHIVGRSHAALDPHALRKLRFHIPCELRGGVVYHRWCTPHERRRERAALPEIVVVGLRDGRAEALLQVRLQ